jgi:hypothetical protein
MSVKTVEQFMKIVDLLLEEGSMSTIKFSESKGLKPVLAKIRVTGLEATAPMPKYVPTPAWDKRLRVMFKKKNYRSENPCINEWAKDQGIIS